MTWYVKFLCEGVLINSHTPEKSVAVGRCQGGRKERSERENMKELWGGDS